jgi:hypothetical protein
MSFHAARATTAQVLGQKNLTCSAYFNLFTCISTEWGRSAGAGAAAIACSPASQGEGDRIRAGREALARREVAAKISKAQGVEARGESCVIKSWSCGEPRSGNGSLLPRRGRQGRRYFENRWEGRGIRDLSESFRGKPYEICKRRFIVAIGRSEMRLVDRLFSATDLPFRLRRPSKEHSQKDLSLHSMVPSHLS